MSLRKSELCRCGCRGWCSMWPAFQALKWSIVAMREGRHPSCRHDTTPFRAAEDFRQRLAGTELGFKAAVAFVKGDWAEFANSL
eukprot:8629458-Alexandrium_andersonii.AAC.1